MNQMMSFGHTPVLLNEVANLLQPKPKEIIVDLTAGRGGHAAYLAEIAGPEATVVLFDLDKENLKFATERVETVGVTVHAFHTNFATASTAISGIGLQADCVLADLGFSSKPFGDAK